MSTTNQELLGILSGIEEYLKQHRELFGDTVVKTPDSLDQKKSPEKKPIDISIPDLFGDDMPIKKVSKSVSNDIEDSYPKEPWSEATDLISLNASINTCLKCSLGHTRTNFVFGVGNPNADLVLVGEAPGADEDAQGEPFVGRAGQLLNKILEAINFRREEVYICNILKCRPPNNRDPQSTEVSQCEPYLWKQLDILKPKLILCLGRIAAQVLLTTNDSLSNMRGKIHKYRGIDLMVTYHPAALLRNPNWKRPAWEDVQNVRKHYDELLENAKS